jgi:competence protein ComEC
MLPSGSDSVSALVGEQEWLIAGTVADDPRPRGERLQLVLERLAVAEPSRPAHAAVVRGRILVWLPRTVEPAPGERIRLVSLLEAPRDFDGFAYREYLARQGIGAIARAYEATSLGGEAAPIAASAAAIRGWLLDGLNRVIPEPEAALGAGILLGVRAGIAPEISDAFATAGLTHVVAISGWNIAIVAGLVAAALRPLSQMRGGRLGVPALTVGVIGLYVMVTGASPSVVRAALMAAALLVARLGGSRAHAASALMLAALLMLLAAPPVLWDVGFQLSLLATAGLIAFGAGVEARLPAWPRLIREPVALTLAAQLTTLPVILLNFERMSVVAPLANVLVVPLVPVAMLGSALAAVVGALDAALHVPMVGEAASWLAGGGAWLTLRGMIVIGGATAALPFASVDLQAPGWLALAWYPGLALLALRSKPRPGAREGPIALEPLRPVRHSRLRERLASLARRTIGPAPMAGVLILALGAISLASLPDGRLHLTLLDVGQGDSVLIETPSGRTMLIDGGPNPDVTLRRLGEELPFFTRSIDVVLLTHPHQDHVAGLVEVLRRYRVGTVMHAAIAFESHAYHRLLADAQQAGDVAISVARTSQVLRLDDTVTLEIVYPTEADAALPLPEGDINNGSVVTLLRHEGFSAMFTGCTQAPVERTLLDRGLVPDVDVLQAGHHGSESSTTPAFLDAANPGTVLISAGLDNEYGHPSAATLATLAARPQIAVRRTDLDGSIEVVSNGRSFTVASRRSADGPFAVESAPPSAGSGEVPLGSFAGSIDAWLFLMPSGPAPSWLSSLYRAASSSTPRALHGLRPRRRAWWARRASRWMWRSSRSPPCSTTSTSRRCVIPAASTASSGRSASSRWAIRRWRCLSRRTR